MNTKRVLIVAYLFPPIGGTAVQRPLKFARYLGDYGWEPVVLTTEGVYSEWYDSSLLQELPADVRVIRRRDPVSAIAKRFGRTASGKVGPSEKKGGAVASGGFRKSLRSLLTRLKNSLLTPDESILWALLSVFTAKRLIEKARSTQNPFHCIYTTSGPHSTHVLGLLLKSSLKIPWVADFCDPWTQNLHFSRTGIRKRFKEWLEEQVFEHADAVVTVTDGLAHMLQEKHPRFATKVQVIRNGVDPTDFPLVQVRKPTERLTLFFGGTLHSRRTPAGLFQAISAGLRYRKLKSNQIRLQFAGVFDEPRQTEHQDLIKELGLQSVVEVLGNLPHSQLLEKVQQADVLLIIGERTGKSKENPFVAGELYEYLYVDKPILALLEPGEAARMIQAQDAGVVVEPGDVGGILQKLLALIERHHGEFLNVSVPSGKRIRPDYTRQGQTAQLADLFNGFAGAKNRLGISAKLPLPTPSSPRQGKRSI